MNCVHISPSNFEIIIALVPIALQSVVAGSHQTTTRLLPVLVGHQLEYTLFLLVVWNRGKHSENLKVVGNRATEVRDN